jgi:hypothetical protein
MVTNKALTIQGQSKVDPVITGQMTVNNSFGKQIIVKNFKMTGPGKLLTISGGVTNFIVQNMTFVHTSAYALSISGRTFGVVDHCAFGPNSSGASAIEISGEGTSTAYSRASALGTGNNVFIENSTIERTAYVGSTHAVWSDDGGGYVFRHNTVTNYELDVHGNCTSGGSREFEIYNNTFIISSGQSYSSFAVLRGGTGVVYNNSITNNGTKPDSNVGVQIREQQIDQGTMCAQGNCPSCNYPAKHQLGRGRNDALDPLYVWGNTVNGVSQNVVGIWPIDGDTACEASCGKQLYVSDFLKLNRDYYISTRPGYTPYTYPHPLVTNPFATPPDGSRYPLWPSISVN